MNARLSVVLWIGLVGFVAGISFFVWTIVSSSRMNVCIACKRSIHAETRTIAEVDGLRTVLCCPTCARMLRDHRGNDVTVQEVTDLETGKMIPARQAYVVVGSEVNYCMREEMRLDEHKQPIPKIFDRCAPSMISFLRLEDAQRFIAQNGGKLMPSDYAFAFDPDMESALAGQ